ARPARPGGPARHRGRRQPRPPARAASVEHTGVPTAMTTVTTPDADAAQPLGQVPTLLLTLTGPDRPGVTT
ncbi:MAG: hypothetical protein WCA29_14515, partial [Jiangellales bacterium]